MKATPGSAGALRPRRWVLVCLTLALAPAVAGCSGGDDERRRPARALDGALSYLRGDSSAVFMIQTDLEQGALSGLDRLGSDGRRAVAAVVESQVGQRGISFDSVVRPRLGNPLVVGITRRGDRMAAIRVPRAGTLRREIEDLMDRGRVERLGEYEGALVWRERARDGAFAALDGSELVVARSERDLHEAIDAARSSGNLALDRSVRTTLADPDGQVRAVGDAQRLLASGDPGQATDARRVRWIRALGIFNLHVDVVGRQLNVDFGLATNRAQLSERDLPLAPGRASPRLHDPDAPASIAILAPQRLVRFLERTLRATDPARFERYETGVEQLRAILRVNLHRDLIGKIRSLSLAATSATDFSFVGRLAPGAAADFRRDLDRAQLFVQGFLGDVVPGTAVETSGFGARRVWVVKNRGVTLARYAVRGGALVGSVGSARLPRPGRGTRLRGVLRGSLALKGDLGRVGRLLGFLLELPDEAFGVVSRLGDLALGVSTDTKEIAAGGRLHIGRAR